jgi:ribonucleoside-diphosphate reductase beta chain
MHQSTYLGSPTAADKDIGSVFWMNNNSNMILHPFYRPDNDTLFDELYNKSRAQDWSPAETDLTQDKSDIQDLTEAEFRMLILNLSYQTFLDAAQQTEPVKILSIFCSQPSLQSYIDVWGLSESVHTNSYNQIAQTMLPDKDILLNTVSSNVEIQKRAATMARYYDEASVRAGHYLIDKTSGHSNETIDALIRLLSSVNILEGYRFYVTFLCHFAFGGALSGKRPRLTKMLTLMQSIARDESIHVVGTQHMLNRIRSGKEGKLFQERYEYLLPELIEMFRNGLNEEKSFSDYLFNGESINNLTSAKVHKYIDHIGLKRASVIFDNPSKIVDRAVYANPEHWVDDLYLSSKGKQTAQQEKDANAYIKNLDCSKTRLNLSMLNRL